MTFLQILSILAIISGLVGVLIFYIGLFKYAATGFGELLKRRGITLCFISCSIAAILILWGVFTK